MTYLYSSLVTLCASTIRSFYLLCTVLQWIPPLPNPCGNTSADEDGNLIVEACEVTKEAYKAVDMKCSSG